MFQHGGHLLKDYGSMSAVLNTGGPVITYLLDVVFADYADDPAPVTSPIVGRTGSLTTINDTGSNWSMLNGQLRKAANVANYSDPSMRGDGLSRVAGLVMCALTTPTTTTGDLNIGLSDLITPGSNSVRVGAAFLSNQALSYWRGSGGFPSIGTYTQDTQQRLYAIAKNLGGILVIGNTLQWADTYGNATTIYPMFSAHTQPGASITTLDLIRAASLPTNATYPVPALGTRDLDLSTPGTGTGTSSIASPAVGNTFVHTADFVLTYTVPTLGTGGATVVQYRITGTDEFDLYIDGANGNFAIRRNGSNLGLSLGAISGGEAITLVCNDDSHKVWIDGSLTFNITDANFKTAIGGKVQSLATGGGAIANLTAKTLDGIANVGSTNHPGYGLATDVLPGPRAAADTFTHEANCVFEFTLDALPSSGNFNLIFREQDINNSWYLTLNTSGDYQLREKIGGSFFTRANAAGVLSGGERMVIAANGTTIKGYYNTTLAWTYASATNFQTETDGEISSLGTGGRVSNLVAWPLNLASAPNTPEAANVKAAFDLMATP